MGNQVRDELHSFLNGEWQYSDWPSYYPLHEYEETQSAYLERCREIPAVSDVWRVGEIGVPGISDLDFVLGITPPVSKEQAESLSIRDLEGAASYISFHQPLIFGTALLEDLFFWGSVSQPVHLWGEKTAFRQMTADDSHWMAIITLNDIFVQSQPRMLLSTLFSRRMHVRGTLCQINALKHTLRIYRDATGLSITPWDDFVTEFSSFRRQWFTLGEDRIEKLRLYTILAIEMLYDLMDAYNSFMCEQNWYVSPPGTKPFHFLASGHNARFVGQWDRDTSLLQTLMAWRNDAVIKLHLPLAFSMPLQSYLDGKGPLSSHVRRYLWPASRIPKHAWGDEITMMAEKHVQTRNAHVEFLLNNGLLWKDANFSSLGLWPSLLTDRSLRGRLRKPYYEIKKWRNVAKIFMAD